MSGASTGAATGDTSDGFPCPDAGIKNHVDGGLSGCAAQVPTSIFAASCEGGTCHNSRDHNYALDLQSANVASRLINVPSLEVGCYKLIDPQNPDQSYLLLKVMDNPLAGSQMPALGGKLSPSQIACLQQWVEAEAATAQP